MRIISGKFKNKKLDFPKNFKTRPLKDNVRENIFNIFKHSSNINLEIESARIIDLYAGTGSFGLECLSRNASEVLFVENDHNALNSLKKNISNLKIKDQTTIYDQDIHEFSRNFESDKKFDLVFFDPPYKDKKFIEILNLLKKKKYLDNNHIILLHREKNSQENIAESIDIIENRIYGRSEIFFGKFF